jgi:membrane-bound lytic murein transglycosylase D
VPVATVAGLARPQRYAVQRGDTLVTVADRYGVSVESLRHWNHLSSNVVRPGSSLMVAEPVKLAPSAHARGRASRASSHASSQASTHAGATHSSAKTRSSASSTTKKTGTKSKSGTSKMKQKAAR